MNIQDYFHTAYDCVAWTAARKASYECDLPASMPDVLQLEDRILYNVAPIPQDGVAGAPEPIEQTVEYLDALLIDAEAATAPPPVDGLSLLFDVSDSKGLHLFDAAVEADSVLSQEIVFVDAAVDDYELFLTDLYGVDDPTRDIEIVLLSSQRDGIDQITDTLLYRSGVDAIHLVSHGDGAGIQLGNTRVDLARVQAAAGKIASWNQALDAEADFLIYGCNLASSTAGRALIESLGPCPDVMWRPVKT